MKAQNIMAEVPPEFRSTVKKILSREPNADPIPDNFNVEYKSQSFTLKELMVEHRSRIAIAFLIVFALTITQNIGPVIFSKAVDIGVIGKDYNAIVYFVGIYFAVTAASVLLSYLNIWYTGCLGQDILYKVRVRVFCHLQCLSSDFYSATKAGHIIARMTTDIKALSRLLNKVAVNLLVQFLALLTIIIIMAWMNVFLTMVIVLTVFPLMIIATLWYRRYSVERFLIARNSKADAISDLRENLYGIKQIMGFNRQATNIAQHGAGIDFYLEANSNTAKSTSLYPAIAGMVEIIAQVILFYMGYQMVVDELISVGELIAYSLLIRRLFNPIERMSILFGNYQEGRVAATKIAELMAVAPSVRECDRPQEIVSIKGDIRFDKVSFAYPGSEEIVLHEIDFTITAGETVAIVGQTGAGKSTIIKLINRLYDPDQGRVTIDECDVSLAKISSLRSQIGVIQQDPFLFNGTIRDNIVLSKPDATEQEIKNACRFACLDDFISQLPEGLNTVCQGEGASFSAGEKQLIIIARLFLSAPSIVLFDEAASNIDHHTEIRIEQALKQLMKDKTAIVISHRLQNIHNTDRVLVIADHGIVQMGKFEELAREEGIFKSMLNSN